MTTASAFPAILADPDLDPDMLPALEMDGYLTGILVTPELDVKSWVAGLWQRLPDLGDKDRMQRAFAGAVVRLRAIHADLQKGWPAFRPSFSEVGQKPDHDRIRIWVRGFWKAMRLDPEYWSDLADDEKTGSLVGLFVGFIDMIEPIKERDDADDIRDEHAVLIPKALVAMRKLALLQEGDVRALTAMKNTKVGRNAPCPCGSGQKFKRCCGDN
jgi:uncharacterized protein